jgi:toxin ParE1/3/4
MSQVLFSQAAVQDRRTITAYTVERFGVGQARRLRAHFEATLERLVLFPKSGQLRPELDPEGRTFRYVVVSKSFILVYETHGDGIRVARILHGARQLTRELERDQGDEDEC